MKVQMQDLADNAVSFFNSMPNDCVEDDFVKASKNLKSSFIPTKSIEAMGITSKELALVFEGTGIKHSTVMIGIGFSGEEQELGLAFAKTEKDLETALAAIQEYHEDFMEEN